MAQNEDGSAAFDVMKGFGLWEEIIKWSIVVRESSGSRQLGILKRQFTVS